MREAKTIPMHMNVMELDAFVAATNESPVEVFDAYTIRE